MGSGPLWMGAILAGIAALLSYFGQFIEIAGVQPDLILLFVLFFANAEGPFRSQVSGVIAGVTEDLMSLSPLGFHLLLRATLALLFGQSRNKIFLDPLVMPVVIVALGTLTKGVVALIVGGIFNLPSVTGYLLSTSFLIEIAYNTLLAPVFYFLFGFLKPLVGSRGIRVVGSR